MTGNMISMSRVGDSIQTATDTTSSNEFLETNIARLESDIADGSWINTQYALADIEVMPALVNQANNKYPGINLEFVMTPQDLPTAIKKAIDGRIESSRFIINFGDGGIHFSVIDYKVVNNKMSLILFEPANFNSMGPALLAYRAQMAIERYPLPDCCFSAVEMDIQRSSSECGIFSLVLAKKLHRESDILQRIHKDNIDGVLYGSDTHFLPRKQLDTYLPLTFYKHTQGMNRLNEYMHSNPGAENQIINKKN
ncbi:YopJ/AvrA family T3SS effector serine/threonine acetyltransferase [Pseudomonas sp. MDT1-17]